jgi:lysozyme
MMPTPANFINTNDYAGKYLREYEGVRYSLTEWALKPLDNIYRIIIPSLAEEFADVSFYQAVVNWSLYKQQARAAILRLGQHTWPDAEFEYNYALCKQLQIAVGGYFFFDDRASPQQQVDLIIQLMQGKTFELELFVDFEVSYGGAYKGLANAVKLMKLLDAANLKVKAIGMYTGYYYFTEHSNPVDNAAEYTYLKNKPLWLAWYAAASIVKVPAPWSDWTHWQYGTPEKAMGQPTIEIDMNKANATPAEFTVKYLGGGSTPPPTTGGQMKGTVKTGYSINVRDRTAGKIVATLRAGDAVYGIVTKEGTREYIYFDKIYRANGTVEPWPNSKAVTGDGASPQLYYMAMTTDPEPVTPPVVLPSIFITHTFTDTLVVTDPAGNTTTYTATWTSPNVEYKPTA